MATAATGPEEGKPEEGKVTKLEVYKQHCEWRSRYADNRFKQLTQWFGATTLLVTAGFHRDSRLSLEDNHLVVPLLGVLLTYSPRA